MGQENEYDAVRKVAQHPIWDFQEDLIDELEDTSVTEFSEQSGIKTSTMVTRMRRMNIIPRYKKVRKASTVLYDEPLPEFEEIREQTRMLFRESDMSIEELSEECDVTKECLSGFWGFANNDIEYLNLCSLVLVLYD